MSLCGQSIYDPEFNSLFRQVVALQDPDGVSQVNAIMKERLNLRNEMTGDKLLFIVLLFLGSTALEQVVACVLVTQRARVRSPVGTGFLGEVFLGFFLTCKTNVRKL